MEFAIGIIAFVVTVVGLIAALGHVGYLAMLNSAARKRGASGAYAVDYVGGRWKVAGITAGAAALALLISTGGVGPDILAILLGGGAGAAAKLQLDATRNKFRNQ
jgi:hypothetical protein